jgi:cyclophilin family peptidyl-prolyl cis-trans isomerase
MTSSKRERQKAGRRERLERMERADKKRKGIRRGVIIAVIAVIVVGTGAFLFSGNNKPTTTTTTPTTAAAATTTTTAAGSAATIQDLHEQTASNAKAVAYGCPASTSTRVNSQIYAKAPAMTINTSGTYDADFDTTAGNFVVQLDTQTAPITTNNFVFLAEHDFYKCVVFQRVIPGFMIQGGDPTGTGSGGPGYTIPDEYPKTGSPTYPLYSIAMANTGQPHTGGSQFFIVTGSSGETLPATYSLFGKVVSGDSVVMKIQDGGNSDATANGTPPFVTYRILNITIKES